MSHTLLDLKSKLLLTCVISTNSDGTDGGKALVLAHWTLSWYFSKKNSGAPSHSHLIILTIILLTQTKKRTLIYHFVISKTLFKYDHLVIVTRIILWPTVVILVGLHCTYNLWMYKTFITFQLLKFVFWKTVAKV